MSNVLYDTSGNTLYDTTGTSGTFNFAPQIDDLLTEAWERLALNASLLTGEVARSARRSLQLLLIDWANAGPDLWRIDRQNTVLTPGSGLIAAPPATIDILNLIVTQNGIDIMLAPISRDEWIGIPDKTLQARPTQFWSERRIDVPVIHLWPVPDQAYPMAIERLRMPQDVSALSQTPDAPVLWASALAAGLAFRLARKYAPSKVGELKLEAQEAYSLASRENRERVPLTLVPRLR